MVKGNIWQVAVLALALALLVGGANVAFSAAAEEFTVEETATVDYSTNYTLQNDDAYRYVQLTITSNGTELSEPEDYVFNETSAEVDWQTSPDTTEGDDATLNYTYEDHSDLTRNFAAILGTAGTWIGLLLMVAALGYLLVIVFGGW